MSHAYATRIRRSQGESEIDFGTFGISIGESDGVERSGFYDKRDSRRRHLYAMRQVWNCHLDTAFVIGRNPGLSDHRRDDDTTLAIRRFVERSGFGSLYLVNVYALRSKSIHALRVAHQVDPFDAVGPMNTDALWREMASNCRLIVGAWGANLLDRRHGRAPIRVFGARLHCWGRDRFGNPNHALKISTSTPLVCLEPRLQRARKAVKHDTATG